MMVGMCRKSDFFMDYTHFGVVVMTALMVLSLPPGCLRPILNDFGYLQTLKWVFLCSLFESITAERGRGLGETVVPCKNATKNASKQHQLVHNFRPACS